MRIQFFRLVIVALLLLPALAGALPLESSFTRQINEIRELNRFNSTSALQALTRIEPELARATPSERVDFYTERCLAVLRLGRLEEARAQSEALITQASAAHDDGALAEALLTKSIVLERQNEHLESVQLLSAAARLAAQTTNRRVQIQVEIATSLSMSDQGDFAAALSELQGALTVARELNDPAMLSNVLNTLASLYDLMKEYNKGFAVAEESYNLASSMHSVGRMAMAKLGEYGLAIDSNQSERARKAVDLALSLSEQIDAQALTLRTLLNLSDRDLKTPNFDSSIGYSRRALTLARSMRDPANEANAVFNLGIAYLGQGKIALGVEQCEIAMRFYEGAGSKPDLQDVLQEYGGALERAGQYQAALRAYHRERALTDELSQLRRQKAVAEVQEKYEATNRQRQITSLMRDNRLKNTELDNRRLQQRLWWMLSVLVGMAMVVLVLVYRRVRGRNRQLEQNNSALKYDNVRDPLTGLYNRRHFHDVLRDQRPGLTGAADGQTGALFVLDLDHFKRINDTYGHAAGDEVLKTVSHRLQEILRGSDMLFRWGGEEFLAYLPLLPRDEIDELARRILHGIGSTETRFQEHRITVGISIGYAPYPMRQLDQQGQSLAWDRVLHLVDMALYLAKAEGRNRACGLPELADLSAAQLAGIEQDLAQAWRDDEIALRFITSEEAVPA
ncbi:MAG: GGDEF domain-containing protein [Pseudomonadota bacterium]|nr:GGDEF domain-containing protein [Pseudomonadota bacterium]